MRHMLALCVTLLVASVALAAAKSPPAKPCVEPQTGLVFPLQMGTMNFSGTSNYSKPSLGDSVHYQPAAPVTDDVWADVYIYDWGRKNIPDGAESDDVKAAFEEAQQSVRDMEKRGSYKDVKVTVDKPLVVKAGDKEVTFLSATFEYVRLPEKGSAESPQSVISHLLITGNRGTFIKVRLSYDTSAKAVGAKVLAQFMTDLGAVLGQKTPPRPPHGQVT